VHETGRREILGLDVGEAETEAFWTASSAVWSRAA
jgi:transposase-like protein